MVLSLLAVVADCDLRLFDDRLANATALEARVLCPANPLVMLPLSVDSSELLFLTFVGVFFADCPSKDPFRARLGSKTINN